MGFRDKGKMLVVMPITKGAGRQLKDRERYFPSVSKCVSDLAIL